MNRTKNRAIAKSSLELLFNISRELNTSLDLYEVLQRVLKLSIKSIGAINGTLVVLNDQGQPVDSLIITGDQVHTNTTGQLKVTIEDGLAGWVARNRQVVLIPDTSQDERWLRRPDDALDRTGPKSAVCAPVLAQERLVGVLTLIHPDPGFFQAGHQALVQVIAGIAGNAIHNTRLYSESQRRAQIMMALSESAMVVTASLEVEEILQRLLEQTRQTLQVETVSLIMVDPFTLELTLQALSNEEQGGLMGLRLGCRRGVAGWVAQEGLGILVPDVSKDTRFSPEVDNPPGRSATAIACAPVRSRGQVTGVIEAVNPLAGAFVPEALQFLTGIASLAGSAIRRAELIEGLQSAHQRYRDLFEDSINPILVTGWDGRILEANRQAERLTGFGRDTLQTIRLEQLGIVHPGILGAEFANLASGATVEYEASLKRAREVAIPVQVNARKVQVEGSTHIQWTLKDVTIQKELQGLQEDLFSMVYHDLRSPLSNILSSLNMIENFLPSDELILTELLQIASRSAIRIQRLINSLLDIQRLEAGQPVGKRQPIAALVLLKEAFETLGYAAEGRDQEFRLSLEPDLPQVFVDPEMILRVLLNLLENALKFSPQGSKIQMTAQRTGDWLEVGVVDSGPGIPEQDQERIFEKFTRLPTPEGIKGIGMGLSFCRLAIESHGGRIWVENDPQAGACFKLTLPIWKGDEPSN